MNEQSWWIIVTAMTAISSVAWFFFRRFVSQIDKKTDEIRIENNDRLTAVEAMVNNTKDVLVKTVRDIEDRLSDKLSAIQTDIGKNYVPRYEYKDDINRLYDKIEGKSQ